MSNNFSSSSDHPIEEVFVWIKAHYDQKIYTRIVRGITGWRGYFQIAATVEELVKFKPKDICNDHMNGLGEKSLTIISTALKELYGIEWK